MICTSRDFGAYGGFTRYQTPKWIEKLETCKSTSKILGKLHGSASGWGLLSKSLQIAKNLISMVKDFYIFEISRHRW
jgi:hypothetical protein